MEKLFHFQYIFTLSVLVCYSVAEFIIQKIYHSETGWRSFLITRQYVVVLCICFTEFFIKSSFYPATPGILLIFVCAGVAMVVLGLLIRFTAIVIAGKSFTHLIASRKSTYHKLVTHGIYKYVRHPGYLGFYLFALGTQFVLVNPFSFVLFSLVLLRFFHKRINVEEKYLIDFYGDEYIKYRKKTKTWMPGIP